MSISGGDLHAPGFRRGQQVRDAQGDVVVRPPRRRVVPVGETAVGVGEPRSVERSGAPARKRGEKDPGEELARHLLQAVVGIDVEEPDRPGQRAGDGRVQREVQPFLGHAEERRGDDQRLPLPGRRSCPRS